PQSLNLAEFIEVQEQKEEVQRKVQEHLEASPLIKLLTSGDIPKPLSYEEAVAIDDEILLAQKNIATTRERIATILGKIDEIGLGSGQELNFKLDISKKTQLKKAIRQAFGIKTDTISYSMYKAAIEAKKQLEKTEAKDYVNLKWNK
ncbi:MAG: hypothetical protein ACKO96_48505, partial [Flammeovirgaceae bacterium]